MGAEITEMSVCTRAKVKAEADGRAEQGQRRPSCWLSLTPPEQGEHTSSPTVPISLPLLPLPPLGAGEGEMVFDGKEGTVTT